MEWELSGAELKQKLDDKAEVVLLDVRETVERATAAIEPSMHIPMGDIPARMQELDPDQHIVVYCHHGVRSLNVTAWLRQQGFDQVQSLRGGIDRWSRDVDPKVPLY
ncbi:MAG: rhodanese-like domain-containing protein [Acidobacteriaceae bacterium]